MILLDTDTVSELFRSHGKHLELERRIRETPPDDICISSITVGEIMEGALAVIRKQQARNEETTGYDRLIRAFRYLNRFVILPYDEEARTIFLTFSPAIRRIGREDCQIAAIAIRHQALLVTRNLNDFQKIPGVTCEDWTADLGATGLP